MFDFKIICYLAAVVVGILVSIVDLISKYGAGNDTHTVLWGKPQGFYYIINGVSAGFGLFVSETMGQTEIFSILGHAPEMGIVKAMGVGFAAMLVLRSSVFSINSDLAQGRVDVGPAHIVNIMMKYIERQIDKKRMVAVVKGIFPIIEELPLRKIYPNVLVCLLASETLGEEVLKKLRQTIDAIMSNTEFDESAKSLAVCLTIHKELGFQALEVLKVLANVACNELELAKGSLECEERVVPYDGVKKGSDVDFSCGTVELDAKLEKELSKLRSPTGQGDE